MRIPISKAVQSAALIAFAVAPLTVSAQQELAGRALVDALQHGGYVVVMRHVTCAGESIPRKSANS
jgi:hypothetical protein